MVVLCGGIWWYAGDAIVTAVKLISTGKVQLQKSPRRLYTADRNENLQSLHTALMLYLDNEGHFPEAGSWMDAIRKNLRPSDMLEGEEVKKLKNPAITGGLSEEEYGYRFNKALSFKDRSSVDKPTTIVVEESPDDLKYNAAGTPKAGKGTRAIAADGSIVQN